MFDLTPLYRTGIGFDRMARLMDEMAKVDAPTYPPYNIELVDENAYRITMAVAGFSREDLGIEVKEGTLTVTGRKPAEAEERQFLHQGIAARNFERRFQLADHVEVPGADLENGLLHIALKRELPETMKPRNVEIKANAKTRTIEGKKAA
jgi:molecular chaperone IbpA